MDDLISRQAAIDAIYACYIGGKEAVDKAPVNDLYAEGIDEAVNAIYELPSVSTEKTDAYKQGWHDAIMTALKETHSVHTEEGHFRVVQEETLIGVGMAFDP